MDSGAVVINVVVQVHDYLDDDTGEWIDCRDENFQAQGAIWIVGKEGKIHTKKVESLKRYTGWDGDMTSLDGGWKPTPCSFTHEFDDREKDWRIGFINDYDNNSTGRSSADLQALQNKYGSRLRAIAGNVERNTAPPKKGKPQTPKPVPALEPAQDLEGPEPSTDDGIPF